MYAGYIYLLRDSNSGKAGRGVLPLAKSIDVHADGPGDGTGHLVANSGLLRHLGAHAFINTTLADDNGD